jgi:DNA invertase Pin-like site-specific DNA recombinase
VVFCDLLTVPPGPAGTFLVTQMAAVAELETEVISQRTRPAVAMAKVQAWRLATAAFALAYSCSRSGGDEAEDLAHVAGRNPPGIGCR